MWQQVRRLIGLPSPPPKRSATSKSRPPAPCSDLYDLVLDMDWDKVIEHCRQNPQDSLFQEGDTLESPLYLACQWSPPLQVLQALIDTNPKALQWTSREFRDLPLHMICRYSDTSVDAIKAFVAPCPASACHATKYGKTALHVLWTYARPECMETGGRPVGEEERHGVHAFWEKMEVLVEAVAMSRQQSWPSRCHINHDGESSSSSQLLYKVHAVVSLSALGCPLEVLEHVCKRYPHQLSQRDGSGQLPLHLAVGPAQWSPTGKRKYKPREQAIIQLLLQIYPEAARRRLFSVWDYYDTATGKRRTSTNQQHGHLTMDRNGRHPLHIALANRHSWEGGVKELFQAAPEVLSIRDPVTQLYPYQLAAIPVRDNLTVDAATIWKLLKQQPELLTTMPLSAIATANGR